VALVVLAQLHVFSALRATMSVGVSVELVGGRTAGGGVNVVMGVNVWA